MKKFFKGLFEYSHYYNQQLPTVFANNPESIPEKAIGLYNHILNAHQIWNNRIHPRQTTFGVWQQHPSRDWAAIDNANLEHSLIITDTFHPDDSIAYTNTRGETFSNTVRDILFHIINHSTYHRAQIAMLCRQHGITPLTTDYISYKR